MGSLFFGGSGPSSAAPLEEQHNPVYHDETYAHSVYNHKSQIPFSHIEALGHGTFGYVDKVRRGDRVYARKTIWVPLDSSMGSTQRIPDALENEVRIIQMARHAHVVSVNGTYMCGREFAIIMTPVADENLEEHLHRIDSTPMDDQGLQFRGRISPWFGCLISGLDYLHSQGIRHRDIKPSNILVTRASIFLTDFGIAMERPGDTTMTETDTFGTKMYRAPEVADGIRSGRRADVFSLGAVFLELISVCANQGKLALLKEYRQCEGDRSYAGNLDKLPDWIASLATGPHDFWGYSTMLVFCSQMLQRKSELRPTADALWSCWSYGLELPRVCLHCLHLCRPCPGRPESPLKELLSAVREGIAYCSLERKADEYPSSRLADRMYRAARMGLSNWIYTGFGAGADIQGADAYGRVALHWASLCGNQMVVSLLLDHGARVDCKDAHGWTSLCLAARIDHKPVVRALLVQGAANPGLKTNAGHTALHVVHSPNLAQILLDHGANIDEQDDIGWTPLRYAVLCKYENLVRLLLARGANVHLKSTDGSTVLDTGFETAYHATIWEMLFEKVPRTRPNHTTKEIQTPSECPLSTVSSPSLIQLPLIAAETLITAPSGPPNPFARPQPRAFTSERWALG